MRGILGSIVLSNLSCYRFFERIHRSYARLNIPARYPVDLNVEITSICNSKCGFCSREELIRNGLRKAKHMDIALATEIIDKLRNMVDEAGVPAGQIRFSPVGLGEPLLHPRFFDIIKRARAVFPEAHLHANSNCLLLNEDAATRLVESGLDSIVLSLAYNDPGDYREFTGVDRYESVVRNIEGFLRIKGNRNPQARIHIFDVPENHTRFSSFIRHWWPRLNRNDIAGLYPQVPLKLRTPIKSEKFPCGQLWNVIMVDVDGNFYPCCIGVWDGFNEELSLGTVKDPVSKLLHNVRLLRAKHADHDFSACNNCRVLDSSREENARFFRKVTRKIKAGRLHWSLGIDRGGSMFPESGSHP